MTCSSNADSRKLAFWIRFITSSDLSLQSIIVKTFPYRGDIFYKVVNLKRQERRKKILYVSELQRVLFALWRISSLNAHLCTPILNHSGFSFFELQSYLGKYLWLSLSSLTFPVKYIQLIKIYLYTNNIDFAEQYETVSYKQQKNVIFIKDNKKRPWWRTIGILLLLSYC